MRSWKIPTTNKNKGSKIKEFRQQTIWIMRWKVYVARQNCGMIFLEKTCKIINASEKLLWINTWKEKNNEIFKWSCLVGIWKKIWYINIFLENIQSRKSARAIEFHGTNNLCIFSVTSRKNRNRFICLYATFENFGVFENNRKLNENRAHLSIHNDNRNYRLPQGRYSEEHNTKFSSNNQNFSIDISKIKTENLIEVQNWKIHSKYINR